MSFDGSTAGTSPSTWQADARLASLPALRLRDHGPVIVVAPHADDETLGAGGLLARLESAGIPTIVLVVTDGGASALAPGVCRATLVATRSGELRAAVAELAPSAVIHELGFGDGTVLENRDWVRRALLSAIRELGASLVVGPWIGDGHRDHRIVGELCAEICAALGVRRIDYPIWMWHWAEPLSPDVPWSGMRQLQLTDDETRRKTAAITHFASQTTGTERSPATLHPQFLTHFARTQEIYMVDDLSLPTDYFDELYSRHDDPWQFETRWYERRKRAITMASLPRERYGSVFEVGCSIGLLTTELAGRADAVLATDIAAHAVQTTASRTAHLPGVTVERRDVAHALPEGPFDLVVLSEVGYYLNAETLARVLRGLAASLAPGGELLVCHWRHEVHDYPLTGGQVHAAAAAVDGLERLVGYVDEDFLLDIFSADDRSVARRAGLA